MVTLGSIQPTNFSAFHGAGPYDDTLNFRSFELALNDVPDITASCEELVSAEERVQEHSKPTYSSPMAPLVPSGRSGITEETAAAAATATAARLERRLTPPQNSFSSDRLLRPSKPEPQSWHPLPPARDDASSLVSCSLSRADRGLDSRLRASSWHAADMRSRKSPSLSNGSSYHQQGTCFSLRSPKREAEPSKEEDKPSNEILDGSDVLQQISNVTSTEPSNEREVFVGGLRESEDSVHITEEELATYFSKFGVIESVSINRDDRTHRGRGFAFVKFFQESAALNAVVADASTHVIRGTTVSVQWSRGAKDGGDRPRRRNSSNSGSGSGNGGSPPRNGRSSSSSKSGMFPPKGHRGGGGSGGSCGGGCSRGFSPLRNRSQSHVHPAGSGAGAMPFAYCGGGHGGDHLNQPMVCVVVPAQRAAALGLSHLPQHAMGSCASRGTPPREIHFPTLTQSTSAGGGHGHRNGRYPSHTRSHSYSISPTNHGHGHSSGGGGYLHHAPQGADQHQHEHHAIGSIGSHHHVGAKTSHSYGVPAPMHMPPLYHERRELSEPRGYQMPLNSGNGVTAGTGAAGIGVGSGGCRSVVDYKRSKFDLPPPSTSYPPPGWSGDGTGMRGMSHDTIRSQSPPIGMRTAHGTRNGGGAPRPTPPQPRGYDKQCHNYQSSRYGAVSGPGDGLPPGIPVIGRRHSGSSLLAGSDSMRQDVLAATNLFYSAGDIGNEHTYDHDFSYGSASRLA